MVRDHNDVIEFTICSDTLRYNEITPIRYRILSKKCLSSGVSIKSKIFGKSVDYEVNYLFIFFFFIGFKHCAQELDTIDPLVSSQPKGEELAVAYKRLKNSGKIINCQPKKWSRSPRKWSLTKKILVFWIRGRLWEVVAHESSIVFLKEAAKLINAFA